MWGLKQSSLSGEPQLRAQQDQVIKTLPFKMRQVARLLRQNWLYGRLDLTMPDSQILVLEGAESGPKASMVIHDFKAIDRILSGGDIGFAEGYRAQEWDTPDLLAVLEAFSLNLDRLTALLNGHPVMNMINNWLHGLNSNTKSGAKKNILAHYDLGNGFYAQWLDKTMTYSSALFDKDEDLEAAQTRKYAELARIVDLKAGQKVLEIGCGWGGFAQYAAQTVGAHVTCLTISQAQYDFAVERMQKLGLADQVEILLMDYRDVKGQYDAIVSIEMFEAVGEIYWNTYFDQLKACLKPGGKAGLQIITIRDDLFEDYRSRTDFIQKYVFPGGMLPSVSKLVEQAKRVGLTLTSERSFGLDYTRTLKQWAVRFDKAWNEGRIHGFDMHFKKLWMFYLAYCAAGFQTKRTDVVHLQLEKTV